MNDASCGPGAIERPILANEPGDYWGSDAVALMLRELDLPYVALNPGASYRGLHDSLVNLLGNRNPQMLLCLHEEHAVAIAHGYRQGDRQADGRDRPQQCRADARDDGDLQRLVRPRAGVRARRHRPGRRGKAAAVDRLDPYRPGPGRARPQFLRNGTISRPRSRRPPNCCCAPIGWRRRRRAARFTSASTPPCRRAGSAPCRHLPSADALSPAAPPRRPIRQPPAEAAALLQRRRAAADPRRPHLARAKRNGSAACRLAEALGAIVLTDAKTGAGFPSRHKLHGPPAGNNPSEAACALIRAGRCDPQPRLGRSRRRA